MEGSPDLAVPIIEDSSARKRGRDVGPQESPPHDSPTGSKRAKQCSEVEFRVGGDDNFSITNVGAFLSLHCYSIEIPYFSPTEMSSRNLHGWTIRNAKSDECLYKFQETHLAPGASVRTLQHSSAFHSYVLAHYSM